MLDPYAVTGTSPPRKGGILVVVEHGLAIPRVFCAACGKQIVGQTGIMVSRPRLEVASPWFVHKGACDAWIGAHLGWTEWLDIDRGIVRMIDDSGLDLATASRCDALARSIDA